MASPFDSAWLKWGRGVVHGQTAGRTVFRVMQGFQTHAAHTAHVEYSPKHHCVRLVIDSIEPLPPLLGLLIGDVANNFRAALDHLAWALVTTRGRRRLKPREHAKIYFPIAGRKEDFDAHLVVSQFLTRADRAIIRRYQPYMSGKRQLPYHCLTPLPGLNSEDKHRGIRPVWAWPQGGALHYNPPIDCEITRVPMRAKGIILEPGAEIQRIYVRRTGPNPHVHMEASLRLLPTLDGKVALVEWLERTTYFIAGLLFEFAEPPEDIRTLGIEMPPRP
jgi:hypothetical protein